jgi:microcin C transport system substrate-binding protein
MQAEGLPEGEELAVLEEFRDTLPPEIFTEPAYTPPVQGSRQLDRSAIRRASALLDEAGWTVGDDGLRRNAGGEVLSLEYVDDNPTFDRVVNPFMANLRRIGVDASYLHVDAAQMQQRLEDFNYDLVAGRFSVSINPGLELRQLYSSDAAEAVGSFNYAGVSDGVVDALIERVIAAEDHETLTARIMALDRVLRSKHIWIPNWYSGTYFVAYWDVFGRPDVQPAYERGEVYWWFDQDKYDRLVAEGALR